MSTPTSLVARTRSFVSGPGGIAVGTAVMNVCTFGFTLAAAGILDTRAYGAFFALLNLLMVISVLSMGLQATAARRIVAEPASVAVVERAVLRVTYVTSLGLGGALLLLTPAVAWLLQLDSWGPAVLIAALAVPTTIMGAQVGILQGEKRWAELTWVYVLAGVPRIAALPLLLWWPTEGVALFASGLGYVAPAVLGWWLLRHRRGREVEGPPPAGVLAESLHGTQALLAFFALANVDIIVARHVLGAHESGLYALGLIVAKMMLFLPQFVIIVMFPSLATARQRRRAVLLGTGAILALGALATAAVAVLTPIAADLLDAPKLDEVQDHLWLFAVLGTLLSVTQLMVYAVLARRGKRSTYLVWAALVAAVSLGSLTTTMGQLLAVMIGVLLVLATTLFVVSLRVDAEGRAPAQ